LVVLTTLFLSVCTLLLFSVTLFYEVKSITSDNAAIQAGSIASDLSYHIAQGDSLAIARELKSLSANPIFVGATLYMRGSVISRYPANYIDTIPLQGGNSSKFSLRYINISATDNGNELHVKLKLTDLYIRVGILMIILILLKVTAIITCSWITFKYTKKILGPLEELEAVTEEIIITKDFSKRMHIETDNEVGRMAGAFNSLLKMLHERDKKIDKHQGELELLVKERTSELMAEKITAEKASKIKSTFLANMSHELRTPLTAIQMYTELIRDGIMEEGINKDRQIEDLNKITKSSEDLLGLIEDILDLTKVESGKIELNIKEVDLGMFLSGVITQTSPLMEKNDNRFIIDVPQSKDITIETDPKRLKQIMENLLHNASKFTKGGKVTLSVWVDTELHFYVEDTGIGMTEEQTLRIWNEFEQADSTISKKYGGTGLGLALIKKLVCLFAGTVVLETKFGVGSKFSVTMPIKY